MPSNEEEWKCVSREFLQQWFLFTLMTFDHVRIGGTTRTSFEQVFTMLQKHNLKINASKCVIGKTSVEYLGFHISQKGYQPPIGKIEAITKFPKPETICQLRKFLGMLNYYRRVVPAMANIQNPLNDFLKDSKKNDKRKVPWNPIADKAFDDCKHALATAAMMAYPDNTGSLVLNTDASDGAIGASIEQLKDNEWRPIGFFSRKLHSAEKNYSTYDRELLAVYEAVRYFHHLLEDKIFSIKTDHKPLIFVFKQKCDKASPRQLRQLTYLSQFNFTIEYLKGTENVVADILSRVYAIEMPTIIGNKELHDAQQLDEELKILIEDGSSSLELINLHSDHEEFAIYCDVSTGTVRPYIPKS